MTESGQKRDQIRGEEIREEEKRKEIKDKTKPPLPPEGDGGEFFKIDKQPYNPKTAFLPASLDTPAFRKAWDEWWKSRRERRLPPYKPTTIAKTLERFVLMGEELAIATIENSIVNAYQGLVEPSAKYQPRPQGKNGSSLVRPMSERIAEAKAARRALSENIEIPLSVVAPVNLSSSILPATPVVPSQLDQRSNGHG